MVKIIIFDTSPITEVCLRVRLDVRIVSMTARTVRLFMSECQSFVLARFSQKDRCFNAFDKR